MLSGQTPPSHCLSVLTCCSLFLSLAHGNPVAAPSLLRERTSWERSADSQDDPLLSSHVLTDKTYLPAQIGGIVGAYALSLVLVAITLLSLAKKRREHLNAGNHGPDFDPTVDQDLYSPYFAPSGFETLQHLPRDQVPNFSYPSPTKLEFGGPGLYIQPTATSTVTVPGVDLAVDQRVVEADKAMAQQQLEDMYKLVMEQEEAKQKGITLGAPVIPGSAAQQRISASDHSSIRTTLSKKEKFKPANLNLAAASPEKTQSRTSSIFSALRSPRKKNIKGVNISSPIMTPQSATFPRH